MPDEHAEQAGAACVKQGGQRALHHGGFFGALVKDAKVEGHQNDDDAQEAQPEPQRFAQEGKGEETNIHEGHDLHEMGAGGKVARKP